jgi:hypothetical protein
MPDDLLFGQHFFLLGKFEIVHSGPWRTISFLESLETSQSDQCEALS